MTWSGWLFMGVSWAIILGVFAYAMIRTLTEKDEDDRGAA